VKDKVFPVL